MLPLARKLLLFALLLAHPAAAEIQRNIEIPMRDGTVLRADVYRPAGDGPFPVLLYRTPYGKSQAAESYSTHTAAVKRGYAVVLQDVRGRYASDGEFNPYRHEGADGYDTIEWLARQPWSNGRIGTYGLSYPGAVQWLAAVRSPPHLVAMAPAMTFSTPRNFFYMNGVFDLSWLPWIYLNIAPDVRARLDLPGPVTGDEARAAWPEVADAYRNHLPLRELPGLRDVAPWYYEWLRHPPDDTWWDWAEIRGHYDSVNAAVLNLSGWHDEAYGPEGAVTNHRGLVASRGDEASARSHLLLGPWVHGVHATGQQQTGDLDFGRAAAIDYDQVLLRFFDEYLRGLPTGLANEPPVRYFVMGANRWHTAESWPPPSDPLHLRFGSNDAGGTLQPVAAGGQPGSRAASQLRADPRQPVRDPHGEFGPRDFAALAGRDDVLTFDSAPLEAPASVAGNVSVTVFVSCDCRDFDLWVRLLDVYPDGRAMSLMSPGADVLRASYRDPGNGRQLLEPGKVYRLTLDGLLTANQFAAGHRLRLQVSASFAPHLSRNLQTGALETDSAASRPAVVNVHHDERHPSAISLPLLRTCDGDCP